MTYEDVESLEDESQAARDLRRRLRRRRHVEEFLIAAAFVASLFIAEHFADAADSAFAIGFVAVAIAVLVAWFAHYLRWSRALDEFERAIDLKAQAFAGGCVILFATAWGVAEVVLDAPDFPIALLAPVYSIVLMTARARMLSGAR